MMLIKDENIGSLSKSTYSLKNGIQIQHTEVITLL